MPKPAAEADFCLPPPNAFFPVLENHRLRGVVDQGNLTEFLTIRAALSH